MGNIIKDSSSNNNGVLEQARVEEELVVVVVVVVQVLGVTPAKTSAIPASKNIPRPCISSNHGRRNHRGSR